MAFMTFPSLACRAPDAFFNRPDASAEVTAQYQRRSPALIIALAPPDVAEPGEAPQVQIEQRSGKSPPALTRRDGDRENFRFARRHARQDETDHGCAAHCAMGDDGFLDQQPV